MCAPVFSIIIPHHNIPKLLVRCLASIPKRDDTEIIIVDDNSDPAKVDFDHFPGLERPDVTVVFDKQGGCAGHARNVAIDRASGKWIIFADADDFFLPSLTDIMDLYADSDADIVYFRAISLNTDSYTPSLRADHLTRYFDNYHKDKKYGEALLRYVFGEPWCRLVRREMLETNHIRFEESIIHNDTLAAYMSGYYAKKVIADDRAIYCVTERQGSLSSAISDAKFLVTLGILGQRERFLRDKGVWVKDVFNLTPYSYLFYAWLNNRSLYREALAVFEAEGFSHWHTLKGMAIPAIKFALWKVLRIEKYRNII